MHIKNIAILASGNGTNFEAIAKSVKRGYIRANLKLLITDKKDAYVRVRAKKIGVLDLFIDPKKFKNRLDFERELIKILKKENIDLIVLAGFMRILSKEFVETFKNKILNIHPAILPAFKGTNAIERTFKYGCKVSGVTVHFVDENVDSGPIILQDIVRINDKMSLKEFEEKIHKLEHKLYPKAIKLFLENRLKIEDRVVKIK